MNELGILTPLRDDLLRVETKMRGSLDVAHPTLAELLTYMIDHGGKRLRPALLIMASRFYPVDDSDKVISAAAAIELLHTASLVHDDLVDNATLRRGSPTLNKYWGGGTTVLIGDYLLARSAWLATYTGKQRLIEKFSDTLVIIVEGELREIFKTSSVFSRDDYERRIYAKTASLFAISAEAGAMLSSAPDEDIQTLRDFGYNLGMAFQIIDDVLDFTGKEGVVGKTVGIVLASWLAVKSGLAQLPNGVGVKHLVAGGLLGGIGFTMSLFIASLALDADQLAPAKVGILIGSAVSAAAGMLVLKTTAPAER